MVATAAPAFNSVASADFYYPTGPQVNVPLSTITNSGWTLCYSQSFLVNSKLVSEFPAACKSQQYVMEVGTATGGSTALLLAAGETKTVFGETAFNVANLNHGTYWYNNPGKSFGFAPNGTISQNSADVCNSVSIPNVCANDDGTLRFSIHQNINPAFGGWRIGRRDFLQVPINGDYTWSIYVTGGETAQVLTLTAPKISRDKTNISCTQGNYILVDSSHRTPFAFTASTVSVVSNGVALLSTTANTPTVSWPLSALGSMKGSLSCAITGIGSGFGVTADGTQVDSDGVQLKTKKALATAIRAASVAFSSDRSAALIVKANAIRTALSNMTTAKSALSLASKSYVADLKAATSAYNAAVAKADGAYNDALVTANTKKTAALASAQAASDAALEAAGISIRI